MKTDTAAATVNSITTITTTTKSPSPECIHLHNAMKIF